MGRLLDRLRSLEAPPGWRVEIVAGLAPSSDNTREILEQYGVRIACTGLLGAAAARNAAIRTAQGVLLYFIDADAVPAADDFLKRLVARAVEAGVFGALGGPVLLAPEQRWNPVAVADHHACWFNWTSRRQTCVSRIFQPGVNLAIPRQVLDAAGGFDERLLVLEDFEVQERIRRMGLPTFFVQDLPVCHRARGTPWSSWRHSWQWGYVFRDTFLKGAKDQKWRYIDRPRLFWLNLPRVFLRRVRLVLRQSWQVSKGETVYCFPFLLATILAWSVAVVVGRSPPGDGAA